MKYRKRISALLLAAALFCSLHTTAYASGIADKAKTGTITVEMVFDGKAVTGGTLTVHQLGLLQGSGNKSYFAKTDTASSFSDSFDDLGDPKLAEEAAAYVQENNVPPYATAENEDGKAVFANVPGGVYLVMQTVPSDGFEPLSPFLVSVPINRNGQYTYDVNAEGKFQLNQLPTPSPSISPAPSPSPSGSPSPAPLPSTSPTPSPSPSGSPSPSPAPTATPKPNQGTPQSGPKLPQTGQLNWPVPVLAVLGLALITVGWILRNGKKNGYEK